MKLDGKHHFDDLSSSIPLTPTDEELRIYALPVGTKLDSAYGIRVGDHVRIDGWVNGTTDVRLVTDLERGICQGGVMMRLSEPLRNGADFVSIAWAHSYNRSAR